MGRRIKVSLTLDEHVLQAVDREAAKKDKPNRSEVIEQALRLWMQKRRQLKLNHEVEQYYRSLTPEAQQEDAEWTELSAEAAKQIWDKV